MKDATGLYGPADILINDGAVTFYYPIELLRKRFN